MPCPAQLNYLRNCGLCYSTWTFVCALVALSLNNANNHTPFWLLLGGYLTLTISLWLLYMLCFRHTIPDPITLSNLGKERGGSRVELLYTTDYHRMTETRAHSPPLFLPVYIVGVLVCVSV